MQTDVFISHSSEDRAVAQAVCAHLERRGLRCWLAPRDVPPGAIWAEAIVDALANTRVMVLVLTTHANASPQVLQELERAVNRGLVVIPFRLENVAPSKGLEYFLGSRHWLDALTPPLERHIGVLGDRVEQIFAAAKGHPVPEAAPPVPPPRARSYAILLASTAVAGAVAAVLFWQPWRPPDPTDPPGRHTAPDGAAEMRERPTDGDPPATMERIDGASAPNAMLPGTIWAGAFRDAAGNTREGLLFVERRTNERVSVAVYFPPESGATAWRWSGTLGGDDLALEGSEPHRQRMAARGRVVAGRFSGNWRDDGGRSGTFAFDPVTSTSEALLPGTVWRGELDSRTAGASAPLAFSFRVVSRQREHVNGRSALAAQRGESALVGALLGDRFIGTLHHVPLPGAAQTDIVFSAAVLDDTIAGTWTSDAGFAGTLRCTRE